MSDIDDILKTRRVPQAPEDMNARIIARAHRIDRKKSQTAVKASYGIFSEIGRLFVIPKPAYAFATLFVVGIISGAQFDLTISLDTYTSLDVSGFLEVDGVWSDEFLASEEDQ